MKTFLAPFITLALCAIIGSLPLYGQAADQQLKPEAFQKRTDEGVELKLILTNVSPKPVKLVTDHLQTIFPGRGGQGR